MNKSRLALSAAGYLSAAIWFSSGQAFAAEAASTPGLAVSAGVTSAASPAWANPTGDHTVVMEEDITLPDHTIYRPAELGAERLPVVVFSGPGCDFNGTAFRPFFTELASHGYLVVVSGPPEPRGGSGPRFVRTRPVDLSASISWALAENGRADSRYFQRVDAGKVAMMGQSCGGLQALSLAADPRISTIVLWNSGVFNTDPPTPPPSADQPAGTTFVMPVGSDKTVLKTIKVPVAYFAGGTDMAAPNARDDFERLSDVPVVLGILEIEGDAHAGTFRETNGGKFAMAALAWLDWQLRGNQKSATVFVGDDCVLCADPDWEIRTRGF